MKINTHASKTTVGQVRGKRVENQKPRLGIFYGLNSLWPLEHAGIHDSGFVLQGALHSNSTLIGFQKDGLGRRVRQQDEQYKTITRSDGAENKEQEFPVGNDRRVNSADTVGNHTTNEYSNTVSEEPGRLSKVC